MTAQSLQMQQWIGSQVIYGHRLWWWEEFEVTPINYYREQRTLIRQTQEEGTEYDWAFRAHPIILWFVWCSAFFIKCAWCIGIRVFVCTKPELIWWSSSLKFDNKTTPSFMLLHFLDSVWNYSDIIQSLARSLVQVMVMLSAPLPHYNLLLLQTGLGYEVQMAKWLKSLAQHWDVLSHDRPLLEVWAPRIITNPKQSSGLGDLRLRWLDNKTNTNHNHIEVC